MVDVSLSSPSLLLSLMMMMMTMMTGENVVSFVLNEFVVDRHVLRRLRRSFEMLGSLSSLLLLLFVVSVLIRVMMTRRWMMMMNYCSDHIHCSVRL